MIVQLNVSATAVYQQLGV